MATPAAAEGQPLGRDNQLQADALLVFKLRADKGIQSVNLACLTALGYTESQALSLPFEEVLAYDTPGQLVQEMWTQVEREGYWAGVLKYVGKDGRAFWVYQNMTPVHENKENGFIVVASAPSLDEVQRAETNYQSAKRGAVMASSMRWWVRLNPLRNLKIWKKLACLLILFAIPLAVVVSLFIASKNLAINFAQKEIYGVEYNRPLIRLLQAALARRSLLHRSLEEEDKNIQLSRLNVEIERYILELDALNRDMDHLSWWNSQQEWDVLKQDWNYVKNQPFQTAAQYEDNWIDHIIRHHDYIGDVSNLILDPDLDTYYLMDILIERIPYLVNQLGKINLVDQWVSESQALDDTNILFVLGNVKRLLDTASISIKKVFRYNKTAEHELARDFSSFYATNMEFINLVADERFRKKEVTEEDFVQAQNRAMESSFILYDDAGAVLIQLLDKRIRKLQLEKHHELIFVAAFVILSLLMFYYITRSITRPMRRLVELFNRIGEGHYNNRIEMLSQDEIGQAVRALQIMQIKLVSLITSNNEIMYKVQVAADSMDGIAGQISEGNRSLSTRTESQAAALEETAASMEEMTATVKQNADNAQKVAQLVSRTRDEAKKGGEVVEQAVGAMQAIKSSSKEISDIISVIDEIAFQTNLLALNAAVEAARAGEQGRGFAVVANEVRHLAQRSASAAKEIKGLIQDSGGKVEEGTRLVDLSGKTLSDIIEQVQSVSEAVTQIADGSREQAEGIEQVNKAIMSMDEGTQSNAALVQEIATTSQVMLEQAQSLKSLVMRFTQEGEAVKPVSHPQPMPPKRNPPKQSDAHWEEF